MTFRRYSTLAGAVLVAALAGLSLPALGLAQVAVPCAEAPAPVSPTGLADDAIETRNQRIDDAQNCEAIIARLDSMYALQEAAVEDDATSGAQRVALAPVDRNRLDLSWWGTWALLGTFWAVFAGFLLLQAFRFWRE